MQIDNSSVNYRLAIVIPCFNEEKRIDPNVYKQYIGSLKYFLLCFVDDGSTDNTACMLKSLQQEFPDRIILLQNDVNIGKAEAVRRGMLHLKNYNLNYVGYWDADMATPFAELVRLFEIIYSQSSLLLVFGSRVPLFGANVKRSGYRYYAGRVLAGAVRYILALSIYDTQCGVKIFHHTLADQVFSTPFKSRWLFDVEIFAKVKSRYGSQKMSTIVKEIPLHEYMEIKGSKISILDYAMTPFYLIMFAISMRFYKKNNTNTRISPAAETVNI